MRSFIPAVSFNSVLLLTCFDHFSGHFYNAVVFVSRAVLELDWAEKIVESACWIALDSSMIAPGVLALIALCRELIEKILIAIILVFAGSLASLAPLEKRPSELLADDAVLVLLFNVGIESGATLMVSNVRLGLIDVWSEGDFLDLKAAS